MAILRHGMPEQDAEGRSHNFGEVNLGYVLEIARAGGRALPAVPQGVLHRRLPGRGQHPALHLVPARRRRPLGGRIAPRRQRPAVRHRPGLPAGDAVRAGLPARQDGQAGRHRLPRALRRRLGAAPHRPARPRQAAADRQARRDRRLRAGRPDRRRRAGPGRPRRHHLRGLPRRRRRADLRHPRVPPAEGDRPGRGRPPGRRRASRSSRNAIIGKTYTLAELREQFDAIFIAVGAGLPVFMNVPGENLKGV